MNDTIKSVLLKLEKQSELEKSGAVEIAPQDRMLAITPDTGKFFNILLKGSRAKRILEIGTSAGYSALWFADAVIRTGANDASIITIEENPSKTQRAADNFYEAGVSNLIKIQQGKAIGVLQQLSTKVKSKILAKFDFVFIDADKENMIQYFDLVFSMVKVGGIIAADNMLYPEKYRSEMKKYSRYIKTKPNAQTVTIPIGNGEEISIKVSD